MEALAVRPVPADAAASAPRLQIWHVLLFTACTGGCLLAQRYWLHVAGWMERSPGDVAVALLAAKAICVGPALGTVCLWRGWRARGFRFPLHGGEWLLVVFPGFALLDALLGIMRLGQVMQNDWLIAFNIFGWLAGSLTLCLVMLWLAVSRHRLPARWRAFCGVKALTLVLAVVLHSPLGVSPLVVLLESVTLSIVALLDWRAPRRFPWTHWLGVAVCLLNGVLLVTQELWWAYLFHRALSGS